MKKMRYVKPDMAIVEVKVEGSLAMISNTMPEGPDGEGNFGGEGNSEEHPLDSKDNSFSAWDTWE